MCTYCFIVILLYIYACSSYLYAALDKIVIVLDGSKKVILQKCNAYKKSNIFVKLIPLAKPKPLLMANIFAANISIE